MEQQQLPHDIYGLASYGLLWYEWLLLAAVTLLVIGVVVLIIRKLTKRKTSDQKKDERPALIVLLERARSLAPARPFERTAQAEFYYQLSLIIRQAIETLTKLPATDLTFKELKGRMQHDGYRSGLPVPTNELLEFLYMADHVKFAERERDVESAAQDQKQVVRWLEDFHKHQQRSQQQEVRSQ